MKTRKILAIAIITIMFLALFIGTVSAVTVPEFMITSNQYSDRSRMDDAEVRELNVDSTLQLYTVIAYGNDLPATPDDGGWYVLEADVEVLAWTSSDTTVATVSSTGLVTGKKAGTTTITATTKDPTTDGDPESIKTATVEITVNSTESPVGPDLYDFSSAKIEMVKEKGVLFYDAKMYVSGIDTANVKSYAREHHSYFYLYVSDKADTTLPTTFDDMQDMMTSYGKEISYPVVYSLNLLDNNKFEVSGDMNELYAKLGNDFYATILESHSDQTDGVLKVWPSKKDTNVTKPAQEAYGNKIKFDIFDSYTYMAVNEPSSGNQKKMEMKVAKVNDISKYTAENKYTNLMADFKNTTNFVYDNQITFDRNGTGGTNASNPELTTSHINFEKGAYYLVYAKLLGEGKYNEVEDAELYYYTGTMLKPVTEFDEGQPASGGNAVTTPFNISGDNSIATKKIPQTGATPVFMIVLGSAILVAGVFVVANKKYRAIK